MKQTKRQSLFEVLMNIMSGMVLSWTTGQIVYPFFGMHVSPVENIWLTCIFTVISIVRSYCWRRFFNWFHSK